MDLYVRIPIFSILEADEVLEARLPIRPVMPVAHLSDGMPLSQSTTSSRAATFDALA